jgi:hypothetical protein
MTTGAAGTTTGGLQIVGPLVATISVAPAQVGVTIPRNFVGLSLETSLMVERPGLYAIGLLPDAGPNPVLVQLLENLGPGTLRVGTDEVDEYCYDDDGGFSSIRCRGYFGNDAIARLFALATQANWPVLFGVNLGLDDPQLAVEEFNYGIAPLSPGQLLLGLEIGNEPDLYISHVVDVGLPDGGVYYYTERDAGYDAGDIEADTRTYVQAFQANPQTYGIPLAGPAIARPLDVDLITYLPAVVVDGGGISLLTVHFYPTDVCPETNPDAGNYGTVPNILSRETANRVIANVGVAELEAQDAGVPLRLGECNSTACGGADGVSNVLAAALWGLDYMGQVASYGVTGLNFDNGFALGGYSAISFSVDAGGAVATLADPLYYAMLAFAQNLSGGELVQTFVDAGPTFTPKLNVTAYSTLNADTGVVSVLVINKDLSASGHVDVELPSFAAAGSLTVLTGPALDGGQVTWGGAQVDATGAITPISVQVPFDPDAGCYHVTLPNGTAAILQVPASG